MVNQTQGWTELARDSAELQALAAALTGEFVYLDEQNPMLCAKYEAAVRSGWNAVTAAKRPIGFVFCANTNDVVHAVNYARKNHPHVVVRYNDTDNRALCDGALVLDLSRMKNCRVWPCDKVALVEPGLNWDEVNAATMEYGLAIPGPGGPIGVTRSTMAGAGGLLSRQYGLSCDNLVEVEVVTTDGTVLTASTGENSELFWAIRGAGETVGIVTSMLFKTVEVESSGVYAGTLVFPVEWGKEVLLAKEVFNTWIQMNNSLPANASIKCVLVTPPPEERASLSSRPIHKPSWGSSITAQENTYKYAYSHASLVFTCFYNGPVDEIGTTVFMPLSLMGPAINTIGVMPYQDAVNLTQWLTPRAERYYSEGAIIESEAAAMTVLDAAIQATRKSARVFVAFEERAGGEVGMTDANAMAFPHRAPHYHVTMVAKWSDPTDDQTSETSVQALHRQLDAADLLTGGCSMVDFVDKVDEVAAWGPHHKKKIADLRSEYDPAMVLMINHP